jgi:DNA-binding transcriptional MerR regulator
MTEEVRSITALAEEFGITLRTIRHYEDVGLLTPERRGTRRVFHPRDRIRLRLILRGKRLGFSLPEIRTIVNMYDEQPGEAGQLHYLLDQIDVRRAELDQLRRDIDETMRELAVVADRCREDLARLVPPPASGRPRHAGRQVADDGSDTPGAAAGTGHNQAGAQPPGAASSAGS